MKHNIIILFICIILLFSGCKDAEITSNENKLSSISQTSKNDDSSIKIDLNDFNLEKWQVAYAEFLIDLYKNSKFDEDNDSIYYEKPNEMYRFLLKDLNNNGIPQLIVLKRGVSITVYAFYEKIINTGNEDFSTGTIRYLFSDTPSYSGVFTFHLGGGMNHFRTLPANFPLRLLRRVYRFRNRFTIPKGKVL